MEVLAKTIKIGDIIINGSGERCNVIGVTHPHSDTVALEVKHQYGHAKYVFQLEEKVDKV